MEITAVRAIPLSDPVPEEKRHRTDLGTKVKTDATLVFVETDEGHTGVGTALGHPRTIESIVEGSLAPALVGEDPTYTGRLWEKMYGGSRAAPSLERGYSQPRWDRRGYTLEAISGVDIALWDVTGKAFGQPVYKLLGAVRDDVRAYASGGWATAEGTAEELGGYADKGFDAVKMRAVGHEEFSVENTLERVAVAREALGDDVDLMVDAHGSLDVPTAVKLARRMEEYDLAWFEEPISPDDHPGLAEVRGSTEIPIASGESEFTRFDFRSLLDHGAIDVAQPDVARCGGITESRRVATMASARNVKFAPHAWGSGVLFAASIHLAMSTPNCHVLEVSQGYMPLMNELFEEEFDIRDGRVYAPDRPGLGFTVREDVQERFEYVEGPEYEF
jgi:L-alanine-DL-glutamate epimerase-like enolase superfamily enzyme